MTNWIRRTIAATVALLAVTGVTVATTTAPADAATNYRATAAKLVNGV